MPDASIPRSLCVSIPCAPFVLHLRPLSFFIADPFPSTLSPPFVITPSCFHFEFSPLLSFQILSPDLSVRQLTLNVNWCRRALLPKCHDSPRLAECSILCLSSPPASR